MPRYLTILSVIIISFITVEHAFSAGIVTNTNQSAAFTRMPAREASTEIDAVYYNPAGLSLLSEGLFVSINNQSIFQSKTIKNDYKYLNNNEFKGDVNAPLFPSVYAAYRIGSFAFSAGFNPIGGGGSSEYTKGLPSFEMPISDLVPGLQAQKINATKYSSDIYFKGTSVYWGIQGGITYKINDMLSVFAGARYTIVNNTIKGHLKNVTVDTSGNNISAQSFFRTNSIKAAAGSKQAGDAATNFANKAKTFDPVTQSDSVVKYTTLAATYRAQSIGYAKVAGEMAIKDTMLADQDAEITQTGSGITPILGANISLLDNKLNIGIKYEFNTSLELKNESKPVGGILKGYDTTAKTWINMYKDGDKTNADIPALLSIGASYKIIDNFVAALAFRYFFDKNTNWDNVDKDIDNNTMEIALGLEYNLNEMLLISTGYQFTSFGLTDHYQTDMNFKLDGHSFFLGGKIKILPQLDINIGGMYAMYPSYTKNYDWYVAQSAANKISIKEEYLKSSLAVGLGLEFHLFGPMEKDK